MCTVDNDFEFELRTLTWEIPRVRFEWDVSPPPPPPGGLSLKQELEVLDPHGFELVRKTLEDFFPTLDYVATSSAGAAVGEFGPPFDVSPQALTRAFLASRNADGGLEDMDTLGKRIIQSQHTGVWRLACRSLVDFFDDPSHAGRGKLAPESANDAWSSPEYDSDFDRNLLLYTTLEVAIALEIPDSAFSVAKVWARMCDHGSYLVPTRTDHHPRAYERPERAEVETFLPIVAYGSLNLLRSTMWAGGGDNPSLFPEDLVRHVVRSEAAGDWLQAEASDRFKYAPSVMQRRYCDSEIQDVEISSCLGPPDPAPSFLFDIYRNDRIISGVKTVSDLEDGKAPTPEEGGVWMYANVQHQKAEVISETYKQFNLYSKVYVTSSDDPDIPPGIHDLLDLAVFADEPSCRTTAYAKCRTSDFNREETYTYRGLYGMPVTSTRRKGDWFFTLMPAPDYVPSGFATGVEIFTRSRYHSQLEPFAGAVQEHRPVYNGIAGCQDVVKGNRYMQYLGTEDENELSVGELLNRLHHPTPPPPTPPTPPSPPPSAPPPLPPPPSAPRQYLRDELREFVFEAEKSFCTQVYWRTVDERCDELAVALTQRYHVNELPPPLLPPQPPVGSPPPLPPPQPPLDGTLVEVQLAGALLSTLRVPEAHSTEATTALVYDGKFFASGTSFDAQAVADLDPNQRARCIHGAPAAALPCVSAVTQDLCLDGTRACDRRLGGSDAAAQRNSVDASLELELESPPRFRRAFLHSVKFFLPQTFELANLLFASNERTLGGSGYSVSALRGDGSVAATATEVVTAAPESRELEVLFAPTDDDPAVYRALADVKYVQLVLPGDFRQVWLDRVDIIEKALDLALLSPEPPSPPPRPRSPPAPPPVAATCSFQPRHAVDDSAILRQDVEGCDLTQDACCRAAASSYALEAGQIAGFLMSDHACCTTFVAEAIARTNVVELSYANFAVTGGVGFVD